MSTVEKTEEWYRDYYTRKGIDRNDFLRNPEVLFQGAASDVALFRTLGRIGYRPAEHRLLDVGGASGGCLLPFIHVGAPARLLTCVDVRPELIEEGRQRLGGVDFRCLDASAMPFETGAFDVTFSSTMFVTIPDDTLASKIAAEMIRTTKSGGFIVIRDWTFPKPGDVNYSAVTRRRLARLFPRVELVVKERGSLVPPIGRLLSARLPALYFLTRALLPFLTGMHVYAMRKPS